jgi:hypothetical protein
VTTFVALCYLKHFSTIRCFFDAFRTKENREKKIFISCGEPRLGLGRVLSTGLWSAALKDYVGVSSAFI